MAETPASRFIFFHESEALLRKKPGRTQQKANQQLEAHFKGAAEQEAALFDFKCLEGPVSVALQIHEPQVGGAPSLPPVAKAYIDALQGIAYGNDRQIEHLLVRHDAVDHPMMSGAALKEDSQARKTAAVFVDVEPLEAFRTRYDQAFNRGLWRRRHTPFRSSWTVKDEAKLQNLRRRQNQSGLDLLRLLEERKLRAGFLADIDRPGPLPGATRQLHRVIPIRRVHQILREKAGATLMLPLPGAEKGSSKAWKERCRAEFERFVATRQGLPFSGFVALDIAVRGQSLEGKDLDNLAHALLIPIEEQLCAKRGTVVDYRVYTALGEPEGVQLRIIDHLVLLDLTIILQELEIKPPLAERMQRWADEHQT